MRILVVDDEEVRHDRFRLAFAGHEVVHARSYAEARRALSDGPYDLIQLDHDLMDFHVVDGVRYERTGQDVARLIAEMPSRMWPGAVVVHSWNSAGAASICSILRRAGLRNVSASPFSAG